MLRKILLSLSVFLLVEIFALTGIGRKDWPVVHAQGASEVPSEAFLGQYYNGVNFTELVVERIDENIDFYWHRDSPDEAVDLDFFSVKWRGNFEFEDGTYEFIAKSDDAARVFVDGKLIIDAWEAHALGTSKAQVDLSAGVHQVYVEYFENGGGAVIELSWKKLPSSSNQNNSSVLAAELTPTPTSTPTPTITPTPTPTPSVAPADEDVSELPETGVTLWQGLLFFDFFIWGIYFYRRFRLT